MSTFVLTVTAQSYAPCSFFGAVVDLEQYEQEITDSQFNFTAKIAIVSYVCICVWEGGWGGGLVTSEVSIINS